MTHLPATVARWISIIAHPFVMVVLLVAVPASRRSAGGEAAVTIGVLVALVIAPLIVLMARQVRTGRWGNADASNRKERPLLFGVSLAAMALFLVWLLVTGAESFLVRGVVICGVFVLAAAVLTRWIKLSLHVAFAATTATTLLSIASPVGFAAAAAVPLLMWSRLALARHTVSELLAGLAFGIAGGAALVWL